MPKKKIEAEVKPKVKRKRRPLKPKVQEVPVMVVEQVEPEVAKQEEMVKKQLELAPYLPWLFICVGLALVVAGGFVGALWMNSQRNMLLAFMTIILVVGGGLLAYYNVHKLRSGKTKTVILSKPQTGGNGHNGGHAIDGQPIITDGEPNCINFYSLINDDNEVEAGMCKFEHMDNPLGQPIEVLTFSKPFHIHLYYAKLEKYKRLILPDLKYIDPQLAAEYICPDFIRRYLRHRESLMKYIGPGILAILCCVGLLGIIIISGD